MNQTQTVPAPSTPLPALSRGALIGCVIAAVGAFLPWVTAATIFGTFDFAGTAGDGKFAVALAAVLAGLVAKRAPRATLTVAWLAVIFGVGEYAYISSKIASDPGEGVVLSVGYGVPVMVAGFVVALVAVIKARKTSVPAPVFAAPAV